MSGQPQKLRFTFFGTPEMAVVVLHELERAGFIPVRIVTAPDRKKGRGLILTPPPVKVWAQERGIEVLQPHTLKDEATVQMLADGPRDLFVVAAYGRLLPQTVLDIPAHGTLNVHPSLLPLHRGPSPIEGQILAGDTEVGVSIMLLDAQMDHGPILAQEAMPMPVELPSAPELETLLARIGGALLAHGIPRRIAGEVQPREQDHAAATFTRLIRKEDGELDPAGDPLLNFRKFKAYQPWPGTYFFAERGGTRTRMKITDAALENGRFVIKKVIPEGKKEVAYRAPHHTEQA